MDAPLPPRLMISGGRLVIEEILSPERLREGWRRVRANKGGPGRDGVSLAAFSLRLERNLARLAECVRAGRYRPQPLKRFAIKKRDGGTRLLGVPGVADRVLQSATALVLDELLDPLMSDASFAYRRGRSVEHAVARILTYRYWGGVWVVDADIADYFGSVQHGRLLAELSALVPCPATMALVEAWLSTFSDSGVGIAQGAPISPLLANLYLDPVDKAIHSRKVRLVRYADDLVLVTRSEGAARWARARLAGLLAERGLRLNLDKTSIVSFADGFSFLGYHFKGTMALPAKR